MRRLLKKIRSGERGAALVEFALVVPLFLVLLFGVMEAGWLFSQQVEVRNASREGARMAVVDFGDAATMRAEVCTRAELSNERAQVGFTLGSDTATAAVTQNYESLTGFLPFFEGLTIRSDTEMRLERPINNWSSSALADCP